MVEKRKLNQEELKGIQENRKQIDDNNEQTTAQF